MSKQVEINISEFPNCQVCKENGINRKAKYDARSRHGWWAYMCESHYDQIGIGLGTGKGQKLILKVEGKVINA